MEAATSSTVLRTTPTSPSPLTTTFTPPSSCLTDLWAAHSSGSTWMNLGPIDATECLPSGWSPSSTFSPGLCPSGWIMASNSTVIATNEQTTIGTCCPQYSNWVFSPRPAGASEHPWYTTEICQWAPSTTVYYGYTWTNNGTTISTPGSMTPGGLWNAYGIVVEWQSSDSLYPATATATATTFLTPSATATATTQQSVNTSSGLTTGAKAGIGVGVAVGAICVILALGFLILRRRKRQAQLDPNGAGGSSKFELVANERHELNSTPLHEVEGLPKPAYIEPLELEGSQR